MTYSEKLKDPRWQKKRLEILDRDGFICRKCIAHDKTLHVHHKFYMRGNDPWDYEDYSLITLCHECHEVEEAIIAQKKRLISNLEKNGIIIRPHCPACGNKDYNSFLVHRYECTLCHFEEPYKSNN